MVGLHGGAVAQLQRVGNQRVANRHFQHAGHDLSRDNLSDFVRGVPGVLEVSIGHALLSDALELGYGATVQAYQACIDAAGAA